MSDSMMMMQSKLAEAEAELVRQTARLDHQIAATNHFKDRAEKAETKRDDILAALGLMVDQHCYDDGQDEIDTNALSADASAVRTLADAGWVTIKDEYGRRVIAHWTPEAKRKLGIK